jgi:hypothetical protein
MEGARRCAVVLRARQLFAEHISLRVAAKSLGVAPATLWKWCEQVRDLPDNAVSAESCAPGHYRSGRKPAQVISEEGIESVRRFKLLSNLNWKAGSTPIAIQEAVRRGELSAADAALIAGRTAAGLPPLPRSQARKLFINETTTRALRSPRNAWLDYCSADGSLMLTVDETTGEERYVQPGEWLTLDDGSINLVCVVSGMERPGDKCWEKFGVVIGRFQFLLCVDHRSYFIPGFGFTARPRDSYRAEDLTATLQTVFQEHGVPKAMILEHGVSAANLVTRTLNAVGCQIQRAHSPHQKVVEMVFNHLWTRLSYLPGQVGRFRGEEEETSKVVQAVRSGARDPRPLFPALPDVLAAIRQVIADWNAHRVQSDRYGSWVPQEFWNSHASAQLRRIRTEDAWMFSPVITDALSVRGARVQTSVPIMPGFSTQFSFGADWLAEFHGAKVHLHFNPFASECDAMVVLAQPWGDHRMGQPLGKAIQFDRLARRTRRVMGYGLDPDIGQTEAAAHSRALRRSVQAVTGDGKIGSAVVEVRNASGETVQRAEVSTKRHESPVEPSGKTGELEDRPTRATKTPKVEQSNRREEPEMSLSRRRMMEEEEALQQV